MLGSQAVHDPRVPVVQHGGQVHQQHHRRAAMVLAQLAVGEVHATGRDGLGRHVGPAVGLGLHGRWRARHRGTGLLSTRGGCERQPWQGGQGKFQGGSFQGVAHGWGFQDFALLKGG
mgnify:CR=1 FL=1